MRWRSWPARASALARWRMMTCVPCGVGNGQGASMAMDKRSLGIGNDHSFATLRACLVDGTASVGDPGQIEHLAAFNERRLRRFVTHLRQELDELLTNPRP